VEIISAGSALKICLVAEGKADIYPRFGPTMEWDTAAGHAIAKHAGKNILLTDAKTELSYNKENLMNPWFVVR
jgi:3'(2'), 5'-bisphosphate nucleotidase